MPDSTGWGVHVLTVKRDSAGSVWAGTYGRGIYRLRPGATEWESIRSDTTGKSISWDFVHAFGFGPQGQIWYGTVGNGWGLSVNDGETWKNWTFTELGPEWQYVTPNGIATRGDTTYVATADGLQITMDDGAHWLAIGDRQGPPARGPADTVLPLLESEYILGMHQDSAGIEVQTLAGLQRIWVKRGGWTSEVTEVWQAHSHGMPRTFLSRESGIGVYRSRCGISLVQEAAPCLKGGSSDLRHLERSFAAAQDDGVKPPAPPLTTWFARPIDRHANNMIDQTYRYGSTMGGNFQQHQGVEFNNPDGTPVRAIGNGVVVYAGPAERGALTVAIDHGSLRRTALHIFSVYYHSSALDVKVGDRVVTGTEISRVGHTGRATNDHLHLEVHAAPTDSVRAIVDSLNRYPSYTTNTELWIAPLPGTGMVAGQVFDSLGKPVPQARIYGLVKPEPRETPFSFAETYGTRAHPHPLYQEHFAVSDVPEGEYVVGVEIDGRKELRRIQVEAGKLTWVEFRPGR